MIAGSVEILRAYRGDDLARVHRASQNEPATVALEILPCFFTLRLLVCCALLVISFWTTVCAAQELAPRAYWPAPTGTKVLVFGYQYSSGDILSDPTLPITGVESKINLAQVTYQHTSSLFGRTLNTQVSLPYSWGSTRGLVQDTALTRDLNAMSDVRARVSINLIGAPAMDREGFRALRANPQTIIGASILVQAPTGGYEADKVLNVGTNRWAIKPALGLIWPIRPTWLLEVEIGAWLFGDNDDFVGRTRKQDPILSSEFHLVKRIRPGFWASLDLNYYSGGKSQIDGTSRDDLQRNSRMGATLLYPFKGHHAIRFSYSTGIITKSGGDHESLVLSYIFAWN